MKRPSLLLLALALTAGCGGPGFVTPSPSQPGASNQASEPECTIENGCIRIEYIRRSHVSAVHLTASGMDCFINRDGPDASCRPAIKLTNEVVGEAYFDPVPVGAVAQDSRSRPKTVAAR